jgi:DNA polymerase III delta prime subunit
MSLVLYPPRLRPYIFHGVQLQFHQGDSGAKGYCPFCHDSNLYVYMHKDGWTCNSCLESGNVYSFLKALYRYSKDLWKKVDKDLYNYYNIKDIAKSDKLAKWMVAKGYTLEDVDRWGIVPSITTFDPIIPFYNEKDSLSNIAKFVAVGDKWIPYGTPQCKSHPFRLPGPRTADANWVVEGYSDTINAERFVRQEKLSVDVIGIWGCNGFDESLITNYLTGKPTTFILDNDYPKRLDNGKINYKAKSGIEQLSKLVLSMKPEPDVSYVWWGSNGTYHDPALPDGYDFSDMLDKLPARLVPQRIKEMTRRPRRAANPAKVAAAKRDSKTAVANKNTKSSKPPVAPVKPVTCTSFRTLCKAFKDRMHFSQQLEDTLAVMLSSVVSTPLDGEQLWFRIIGPPGSGKTTLAECLSAAREYVYPLSLQTGFHSGHQDLTDKEKDFSLLAQMNNKTTIIKDADTLLKSASLERILSEMRDFYDGVSRATYRNGVSNHYEDLRITFLLCGTDALRTLNRSDVGERFLDCEIFGDDDAQPYIRRALDNTFNVVNHSLVKGMDDADEFLGAKDKLLLKGLTVGFVNHLRTNMARRQPPRVSEDAKQALMGMAEFIAIVRAKTRRDKDTEEFTKSRVEVPTRLVSQLAKQAISSAIVHERSSLDEDILRISRKIAFDTVASVELDVIKILHDHDQGNGLSCRTIASYMGLSERATVLRLDQLRYFKAVNKVQRMNNSGQRGRDVHHWMLSQRLKEVYARSLDPKVDKPSPSAKTLTATPIRRPRAKRTPS